MESYQHAQRQRPDYVSSRLHIASFLSFQTGGYYVHVIFMSSWLVEYWRLVNKLDNLFVVLLIFRKQ